MKKWIVPLLVLLAAAYFLISLFFAYGQHREFLEIQHDFCIAGLSEHCPSPSPDYWKGFFNFLIGR
ncbi:hypothetical protein [Parasutterella excrementihominis]